jgi:hypothetical protein
MSTSATVNLVSGIRQETPRKKEGMEVAVLKNSRHVKGIKG